MHKNILIVEDESIVAMELESYLQKLNYNVVGICTTADEAYEKAINNDVDLILMDIYLINSDGIEATKRIKAKKEKMPIVFITAYMDEETIDRAIAVNPVAYLSKPFNRKELCVAIKLGLQQYQKQTKYLRGDIIMDEEFSYDTQSGQLICSNEEVHLSKKERKLLELFLKHPNTLISFITMEYELWADKPSNDSRRRTLISRLRAKLRHRFIETLASEGYILKLK